MKQQYKENYLFKNGLGKFVKFERDLHSFKANADPARVRREDGKFPLSAPGLRPCEIVNSVGLSEP